MSTTKTADLAGAALDWAVAKAEGDIDADIRVGTRTSKAVVLDGPHGVVSMRTGDYFRPSTRWAQGGPIIEREGIYLWRPYGVNGAWSSKLDSWPNERVIHDDAPLVAAMRCYVASKLGDEVDIPENLAP